ncbi:MAG TPA: PSD1 and planctomycete cytochrome C domain-containing protein [Bryobacteraceae bacterium]|nr:PSD1 and planctomycete cytochrome C domain-containing protein [Bryobacteraceae bacterium]
MIKFWALLLAATPLSGQAVNAEFFEKEIRPVLAGKCYGCHSSKLKSPMGGLVLDTKAGLRKGGNGGAIVTPGDPKASRLLSALSYTDAELRMPPTGKLTDREISAFAQWIQAGAPDPREEAPATAGPAPIAPKGMSVEAGRKWWAFQPVSELTAPAVNDTSWSRTKIDRFVLAKLEASHLKPSIAADPGTLIRRAYLDLTGLKPTYEEVQAFVQDKASDAYERLIDHLLASPAYGERWGRYWLDVARYAEDNPTSEATNPPYPFAWRYRDWVIEAVSHDTPYDRFVKLQLAADQMPGVSRQDLRALGYLGTGPVYHKDARLSKDVIETLFTDDWDERVDAVSRGILGLTVACARCHDHKFDPIPTKDYYGLAGVFASTVQAPRPLNEIDAETEKRFMDAAQRMFFLNYASNLMRGEPGTKPEESFKKADNYKAECERILASMESLKDQHPEMYAYLSRMVPRPKPAAPVNPEPKPPAPAANVEPKPPAQPAPRRRAGGSTEPFTNSVFDEGLWVDGSDPDLTTLDTKPGVARDLHVLPHGNVAAPGDLAPRHFLSVLSKEDPTFHQGSGRLELAQRIFGDAAPLAARVIVNRVWDWHFGKALVATESDFGTQGEKPTHPELLDDLAARFMANGWSLKWLHREIMLSATYRQSSKPREDGIQGDATNHLLWRMNPRRLDVEAYRDSLLEAAGTLDRTAGGVSADLDQDTNARRTVYGRISRSNLNTLLKLYDFPSANLTSPERELTTTPLQQLFVMNSPFIQAQAEALVKLVRSEPGVAFTPEATVRALYRRVLARDPSAKEIDLAISYLNGSTLPQYAQALLSSNEVIFWP